jgi:hypothetical protein
MSRSDLRDLGETLDPGQAGLIAVYEFDLADQVAATITAANRVISEETDMAADRLAADMRRARRGGGGGHAPPVPQQASRPPDAVVTRTAIAD